MQLPAAVCAGACIAVDGIDNRQQNVGRYRLKGSQANRSVLFGWAEWVGAVKPPFDLSPPFGPGSGNLLPNKSFHN
ncbi:hypothetical protein D3C77_435710 [compost metagenome]